MYEVHRLQELNSAMKEINEGRSKDFAALKMEAQRLKQEFEEGNKKNMDKAGMINKQLLEELGRNKEMVVRLENELKVKNEEIAMIKSGGVGVDGSNPPSSIMGGTTISRGPGNIVSNMDMKPKAGTAPLSSVSPSYVWNGSERQRGNAQPKEPVASTATAAPAAQAQPQTQQQSQATTDESIPMNTPARESLPDHLSLKVIPGKGLGVITNIAISQGQVVGDYKGEVLTREEKDRRYLQSQSHLQTPEDLAWKQSREDRGQTITGTYLYGVVIPNGEAIYVDAEDEYQSLWTRFINHASPPVANVNPKSIHESFDGKPRVWFVANRDIEAGEEICFDYGDDYWLPEDNVV